MNRIPSAQYVRFVECFVLVALIALIVMPVELQAQGGTYVCLPTCTTSDAKMLSLSGIGQNTLAGDTISLLINSASTAATLELGIFDGNTGGLWDSDTQELEFTLYADPLGNGSGAAVIGQWLGNSSNPTSGPLWTTPAATMADNAWFVINVTNSLAAQGTDGNYHYVLKVRLPNAASITAQSNFKIRVGDQGTSSLLASAFAFIGALNSFADVQIVYPLYPDGSVTTYDGIWKFGIEVLPNPPNATITEVTVWDADMDHALPDPDTDDPDTSNSVLPPWAAGTPAVNEGVAVGVGGTTGNPADDNSSDLFRRSPSIRYEVKDPNGNIYVNLNPSGNLEWEQFRISTDPFNSAQMDYHANSLPAGIYEITINGMDLGNLNAWRFTYGAVGRTIDNKPIPRDSFYAVGDTVWRDLNRNGVQDNGEPGISGVLVELLNGNGQLLETTTTDSNGVYGFRTVTGTYSVRVSTQNFATGSPLAGMVSTIGGNQLINTVVSSSILTYDFGYVAPTAANNGPICAGQTLQLTASSVSFAAYGWTGPNGFASSQQNPTISSATTAASGLYTVTVTVNGFSSTASTTATVIQCNSLGTGTPGYWKNHPEAWPVSQIVIAGVTYTKAAAISLMSSKQGGDKTYDMFNQLVAAKLNVAIGNQSSCIQDTIRGADAWLAKYPLGSGVGGGTAAWKAGSPIHSTLDAYNNGLMCAPHRD